VRERICAPFFSPVPWWYSKGSSPPLVAGVTAPAAGNWAGDSTTDRLAQRSTHTPIDCGSQKCREGEAKAAAERRDAVVVL
jgi:hypothetical protein